MGKENAGVTIEKLFREQIKKDQKVKNAYLLVHSDREGIHMNIAEGATGSLPAHPEQPNYMASVGKLFTSTLTGILFEKGKLSFDDCIAEYLDHELLDNLHVYKGKDYSSEIKISHLLNQTSGLPDNFSPLLDKLIEDHELSMTPREAIVWAKNNLKPHFPPGGGFKYTDTNYHLLGLIIENITGQPFQITLQEFFFKPLNMKHSYMFQYSEPMEESPYPVADFFIRETRLNDVKGYASLDYSGGGVVAPTGDLLKFIQALAEYRIVTKDTLDLMKKDRAKMGLGIYYGYGIWQFTTVPLLMPKKFNSWGVAGITGAFMFYHPEKDAYLIGNFNDSSYERKGLRFILFNVINKLY